MQKWNKAFCPWNWFKIHVTLWVVPQQSIAVLVTVSLSNAFITLCFSTEYSSIILYPARSFIKNMSVTNLSIFKLNTVFVLFVFLKVFLNICDNRRSGYVLLHKGFLESLVEHIYEIRLVMCKCGWHSVFVPYKLGNAKKTYKIIGYPSNPDRTNSLLTYICTI